LKSDLKLWITNGILNACKKKHLLYKEFSKKRTKESENKYKIYKNELTRIMRNSKKTYYSKLLEENRNKIRNTWKVLNEIIKNKKDKTGDTKYFLTKNNIEVKDMTLAADEFNDFFVGVGPGLAEEFAKIVSISEVLSKNVNIIESMFVKETDEKEIIEIVETFKSKKSTDWNGIDMFMVKSIIGCVVKEHLLWHLKCS